MENHYLINKKYIDIYFDILCFSSNIDIDIDMYNEIYIENSHHYVNEDVHFLIDIDIKSETSIFDSFNNLFFS